MSEPTVSIVIPVLNGAKTIGACLRSVLELNYPKDRFEVIVIDNGSTDGTAAILESFHRNITRVFEPKRGAAAARNAGIRRSSGAIIAFTDADCVVEKDWLRRLVAPLSNRGIGAVGGKILALPEGNHIEHYGERIHDHDRAINSTRPPYLIGMNCAARREVLHEVKFFDEQMLRVEDVDLSYRIVQAGYTLAYQPDAVIFHRNETSLLGLFNEGFLHGFRLTNVVKKHRLFLHQFGYKRFNLRSYRFIQHCLSDLWHRRDIEDARCRLSFNAGKKFGKYIGSGRYLHFQL